MIIVDDITLHYITLHTYGINIHTLKLTDEWEYLATVDTANKENQIIVNSAEVKFPPQTTKSVDPFDSQSPRIIAAYFRSQITDREVFWGLYKSTIFYKSGS